MLKEMEIKELSFNPFELIGQDWMLITAGDREKHNTMTASWGGLGVLWGKPVSFVFIRPQRYTLEFVDQQEYYSLCFFDKAYRPALNYCGSHSGRDGDKDKETGLTPSFDSQTPYYKEAKLVLICRKLYRQPMDPEFFLDQEPNKKWYPDKDYHKIFVGEIVKVLKDC